MQKMIILFVMLLSLAQAHHMSQSDDGGVYIPDDSPHLDMVF